VASSLIKPPSTNTEAGQCGRRVDNEWRKSGEGSRRKIKRKCNQNPESHRKYRRLM